MIVMKVNQSVDFRLRRLFETWLFSKFFLLLSTRSTLTSCHFTLPFLSGVNVSTTIGILWFLSWTTGTWFGKTPFAIFKWFRGLSHFLSPSSYTPDGREEGDVDPVHNLRTSSSSQWRTPGSQFLNLDDTGPTDHLRSLRGDVRRTPVLPC